MERCFHQFLPSQRLFLSFQHPLKPFERVPAFCRDLPVIRRELPVICRDLPVTRRELPVQRRDGMWKLEQGRE